MDFNLLSRSQRDFTDKVWPVIKPLCGGGDIIPVELVSKAEFSKHLDILAGIDVWHQFDTLSAGPALRGIASRVQWVPARCFDTFTVRRSLRSGEPTEYQKRMAALTEGRGALFPYFTVQAYIDRDDGVLLHGAFARTEDVLAAVSEDRVRVNPVDGSTFYWAPFADVSDIHEFGEWPGESYLWSFLPRAKAL